MNFSQYQICNALIDAKLTWQALKRNDVTGQADPHGRTKTFKTDINELSYAINGAIFKENRELGAGFLEKVYENALLIELLERGFKALNQFPIQVRYKGQNIGEYYADLVVENQIILELKAVDKLQKIHEAQLLNYLKATGFKIGLLVNFRHPKAEIKRFIM